jgi:hypothetical protein
VTHIVRPRKSEDERFWRIGPSPVPVEEKFTHLGVVWKSGCKSPDIGENIIKARRTAYSLINVGLHGNNGLGPATCMKIIQTYITPRLLHTLEASILGSNDIQLIESFYKKMLRQIQNLPTNTASQAIYLMLGTTPIEAQYHIRALTFYGSICRLPKNHAIYRLARRQLSVKNKYSWFTFIATLGIKYDIDIYRQLLSPWRKAAWKRIVRDSVRSHWYINLTCDASKKSSLGWLMLPEWPGLNPHPLWTSSMKNPSLLEPSSVRARMLTGRFRTQKTLAKFYPERYDGVCLLCDSGKKEDLPHMLITCEVGLGKSIDIWKQLREIYFEDGTQPPSSPDELCSALLNGSGFKTDRSSITLHTDSQQRANQLCSLLCYRIARFRDYKLNS